MLIVKIEGKDNLDRAIKKLKRKFDNTRVVRELRSRKEFTKKSVKRREQIRKAIRRKDWEQTHES